MDKKRIIIMRHYIHIYIYEKETVAQDFVLQFVSLVKPP
jgi:hypothetical protein